MSAPRVLMLFGYPRSGSTVLGLLLQERLGLTYCGEVKHFWKRYDTRRLCTCGRPLDECPAWSVVAQRVLGAEGAPFRSSAEAAAVQNNDRVRHAPQNHAAYAAHLTDFYREAALVFGDTFLVDSSKGVDDARLVHELHGVESWFLYLVRDPRGAVYSRSRFRRQQRADGEASSLVARWDDYGLAHDGAAWSRTDRQAAAFLAEVPAERQMTLRYEDFAAEPEETLGRIAGWLDVSLAPPGQRGGETHVVAANQPVLRSESKRSSLEISADRRWRTELRPYKRVLLEAVTRQGRRRHGYG